MARNLTDDEIKWILSVDAQGAQKEIQTFSSEINRLKQENASLARATKDANNFIKDQGKKLKELERQGKQNTAEYQNISNGIAEARHNINQNTRAIEANRRAIDDQNRSINETLRTMKLDDMTMSQLRKRARELQRQLDNTSRALSPEAYTRLQRELNAVNTRMNQLRRTAFSLRGS
jgi:chromosome segregation ATPase